MLINKWHLIFQSAYLERINKFAWRLLLAESVCGWDLNHIYAEEAFIIGLKCVDDKRSARMTENHSLYIQFVTKSLLNADCSTNRLHFKWWFQNSDSPFKFDYISFIRNSRSHNVTHGFIYLFISYFSQSIRRTVIMFSTYCHQFHSNSLKLCDIEDTKIKPLRAAVHKSM